MTLFGAAQAHKGTHVHVFTMKNYGVIIIVKYCNTYIGNVDATLSFKRFT